jgi:hypothetical protein
MILSFFQFTNRASFPSLLKSIQSADLVELENEKLDHYSFKKTDKL